MNNEEKILEMLMEMRAEMTEMRADIAGLKDGQAKLEADVRYTRMMVEDQNAKIRLIAEQHTDIIEKLGVLQRNAEKNDDLRGRVEMLEFIVHEHAGKLQELAKAE